MPTEEQVQALKAHEGCIVLYRGVDFNARVMPQTQLDMIKEVHDKERVPGIQFEGNWSPFGEKLLPRYFGGYAILDVRNHKREVLYTNPRLEMLREYWRPPNQTTWDVISLFTQYGIDLEEYKPQEKISTKPALEVEALD